MPRYNFNTIKKDRLRYYFNNYIEPSIKALSVKQITDTLYTLLEDSLTIETHYQLLNWLQGDLQHYIPHTILISAWGDFSAGIFYLDIVATHPLVRTNNIDKEKLRPQIKELFDLWLTSAMRPIAMNIEDGFFDINAALMPAKKGSQTERIRALDAISTCLIHGIKDNRANDDCLYLFLSGESIDQATKTRLPIFIPIIDHVFRSITPLAEEIQRETKNAETSNNVLSKRESEIMDWVKEGKTNLDIAQILDISIFTVKNHLHKIYQKLDVTSRSQAAYQYKSIKRKD